MYIYQLDRILLRSQIKSAMPCIKGRVLNVGSGAVERYKLLSDVTEYIRMDIEKGQNVDVVGRAEAIPFPDRSFDSIISTQVFEHVENPEQAAREFGRVLKKGGSVLVTVPQWNELHEEPHDYWRYTRYGLQSLFERHGFKLVSMDQRGGYHILRAQMKMRFAIDKYNLFNHPIIGRVVSRLFKICGSFAIWRDEIDTSKANRKHTIGWCAVFKRL